MRIFFFFSDLRERSSRTSAMTCATSWSSRTTIAVKHRRAAWAVSHGGQPQRRPPWPASIRTRSTGYRRRAITPTAISYMRSSAMHACTSTARWPFAMASVWMFCHRVDHRFPFRSPSRAPIDTKTFRWAVWTASPCDNANCACPKCRAWTTNETTEIAAIRLHIKYSNVIY